MDGAKKEYCSIRYKRWRKWNWSLILSVLAFIFSIFAAFQCDKRIEADWMSILVGILSLLVALLVGWQIYNSIDSLERVKRIEHVQSLLNEKIKYMERESCKLDCLIKTANALAIVSKQPLSAYRLLWHALIDALEYNDIECVTGVINNLEAVAIDIIHKERSGKFIYEAQLRVDLADVEYITNMEMEDRGLFPSVRTRYYTINNDMKQCISNIIFQIKNKRIRDYVNTNS